MAHVVLWSPGLLRGAPAFIAGFLVGDLCWFAIAATGLAARARTLFTTEQAVRRLNRSSGVAMASAAVMVATR